MCACTYAVVPFDWGLKGEKAEVLVLEVSSFHRRANKADMLSRDYDWMGTPKRKAALNEE